MADAAGMTSLLQFLPGFMNLMKGMNIGGSKNTASQLANINNAMVNPNNPLYQQMYGQYKQLGQQQLGENVSQMEGQNRMLSAMGRTPLFSPERQGEQAFRAQAMAGPQLGVQAQQQTMQALQNAAHSLNPFGQMNAYQTLGQQQYGPRMQMGAGNSSMAGLYGLGGLLGAGGGQRPQQSLQLQQMGVNAPGAQQGNSLLSMLFGGQ